jgi:hypothetical protein
VQFGAANFALTVGAGNQTFSYTVGTKANRLLIVSMAADAGTVTDHITGVTYGGVPMSLAGKICSAGINRNIYQWFLLNPASGANNIVVSHNSSDVIAISAADYSGVQQWGQPDNVTTNLSAGAVSTLTTSLSPNLSSWLILSEGGYAGNNPPSAGAGDTLRSWETAQGICAVFDSNGPASGIYSMTTNRSSVVEPIGHILASYVPAGLAPNFASFGTLISHWDASLIGNLFQSPTSLVTPVINNGDRVGAIADFYGTNHLFASGTNHTGTYAATSLGGKGTVAFSSTELLSAVLSLATYDFWSVAYFNGHSGQFAFNNDVAMEQDGGGAFSLSGNGGTPIDGGTDDNAWHVFGVSVGVDAAHSAVYIDGVKLTQSSFVPEALSKVLIAGSLDFAEGLLYQGAANPSFVYSALKAKWGL